MCRPLRDIAAIDARLDAVQELIERQDLVVPLRSALQGEDSHLTCHAARHSPWLTDGLPGSGYFDTN